MKKCSFSSPKWNSLLVFVFCFFFLTLSLSFLRGKRNKGGCLDGQTSTELTLTTFFINARHLVPSPATHNCESYGNGAAGIEKVVDGHGGGGQRQGYGKQKRALPPLCLWLEPQQWLLQGLMVVLADGADGGGGGGSCAYFCVTFQSISILCSQ